MKLDIGFLESVPDHLKQVTFDETPLRFEPLGEAVDSCLKAPDPLSRRSRIQISDY
jgi:hypothetical protein